MQLRIPDVTLLEELGRGQASVVFRALHRGHGCTVKVPRDRTARATSLVNFEQDVLQLARLSRAGLPRVLQLDAIGEVPYAILEDAQGQPLLRALEQPISESDTLALSLTLASCLQQLHDAGFVHGALTTEHILVSDDRTRISLRDTGSITRPGSFDAGIDTRAFGTVLQACAEQLERPAAARSPLLELAAELVAGDRKELATVISELQAQVDPGARRRSSYPPPSSAALAPPVLASTFRSARSELSQLRRFWDRTLDHGGKIVEVLGPAGSGKSRLLAAFAEKVGEQNAQVLSVKCHNSDWAPFSALKRLLEGHLVGLAQLETKRRQQIEASLRAAAGPIASRIRLLSPRLAELLGDVAPTLGEGDAQHVFVTGMADFLATYLEWSGPSALVIDDVHWLDASSRMVLSRLAVRLCPKGHLFVCGARDDFDSRDSVERFRATLALDYIETVQLGALSERDAGDLIGEYLGLDRPPSSVLVTQLAQLSDGTPLSLLELLRLTLERGHLRPQHGTWTLDAAPVQRMRLPASSQALIERRLSLLEETTLEVLRAAAVLGRLEPEMLVRVTGLESERVRAGLGGALAMRLIEVDSRGQRRFVHDSVWEALLRAMPEQARRVLHERVADALAAEAGQGADFEYELARHHAAGLLAEHPLRAYSATRRAARRALDACDDVLALSFLKPAETAARLAGIDPDRAFYVELAEASLRTGATQQSLGYFAQALARSAPGYERAHVRGRIAWLHHYDSDAEVCCDELSAALSEFGRAIPTHASLSLLWATGRGVVSALNPLARLSRQDAEILCELYEACSRVSFESGHPARAIACAAQMAAIASRLPPCRVVVRAELLTAFVLSTLGPEAPWRARYERAERIARQIADPIAETLCCQYLHVIMAWRGDLKESDRLARLCVGARGHYMELGELCHMCFGMYGVEIALGRPAVALWWAEQAIERVRQSGRAPAMFALIEEAARSALAALGREQEANALGRRLRFVERAALKEGGYFHVLSYQARVQRFTERGEFGDEFEALIDEFNALGHDPKQVHLLVVIYYLHVAHARVHQCLRATRTERALLLPKLERALRDVEAATSVRPALAHAKVTRAAYLWFTGSESAAERALAEAQRLAEDVDCVWVQFAAARLRAHMLRDRGKEQASLDQARIAELLARQYGLHNQVRFIREEFSLGDLSREAGRSDVDAPASARRHLDALMHISQANSRELGPEQQARVILDELIETLGAERAFLFMREHADNSFSLRAARRVGGGDLEPTAEYDRRLVEQVYATGQPELTETADPYGQGSGSERSCIVVALVLREQAVGVLYLDRPDASGAFRADDALLLQALANQVLVALELASALRERERLEQNLRQAQKMEAIGRLSGGIAHDFNNILSAIQMAAYSLASVVPRERHGHEDVEDIREAARRGAELTRQLIAISRGTTMPPPPSSIVLSDVVNELMPMLRRLVRRDVNIEVELPEQPLLTMAAPSQIERVLMNLCQNASDAMPNGGTITIRVAEPSSAEVGMLATRARSGAGLALLMVSDTGTGMSEEVRAHVFEPFFTTKASQRGTGLGLANVYAIVQQCGGQIEVSSDVGRGTTFRIFFERTDAPADAWRPSETLGDGLRQSEPAPASAWPVAPAAAEPRAALEETVLVVDDDAAIRSVMARTLQRVGYRVLVASNGVEALQVVNEYEGLLDLVVTDVQMDGMDGCQLACALFERDAEIKVLFVSGAGPAEPRRQGLLGRDGSFLQKPFAPDALIARVEALLGVRPESHADQAAEDRL
jgi:eukaryotic-like serine/threonine-protein kinase